MFRKHIFFMMALTIALCTMGVAFPDVNDVPPSTNEINETIGWAHVEQIAIGVGCTDLKFISTRSFSRCFEYRTDGDTSL